MTEENKDNGALEKIQENKLIVAKVRAVKVVAVTALGLAAILGYVFLLMNGHNPGDSIWWLLVMAIVGITFWI